MKLDSMEQLFHDALKDLASAEAQLVQALPTMAKTASSQQLRAAFEAHLAETKTHQERLEQISETLGLKLTGKKCQAMEGLIEESQEVLDADGEEAVIDAALIAAAQRIEHYEISGYGTARALAEHLGYEDVAQTLQETLREESAADQKLTQIAVNEVYASLKSNGQAADVEAEDA